MLSIESTLSAPRLDRRQFLAGAAGLATLAASPRWAFAAAAPYSFKQGDFEITVVSDGHLVLPSALLGQDAPPEEREVLLKAAGLDTEMVNPAASPLLIRSGSDLILLDTGSGSGFQPSAGKLQENLAAAGIDPASITKVVFSHGHPDHIWGTVLDDGKLRYPNAAYYAASAEWDFWMDPGLMAKLPEAMQPFVVGAQKHFSSVKDKVTMVKPGEDIVTGISVVDTAGHTPGHVSFIVAGGEGLIITADAIVNPAVYFPHPEWKFGFDAIHETAIANRKALLDRAATDKIKLIGYHWPYPGTGFAERKGTAYQYVPAA
jgi:glyoxylase-like metal-dependent hydrolase (beta-lactamase superfamily II)